MFLSLLRHAALPLGAILLLLPAAARAQTVVRMIGTDVRHAAEDVWGVWSAPVRGRAQDWLAVGLLLSGAAAASPLDDDVDRWAVRDSASRLFATLEPFRRGGMFFGGSRLVPAAAAVMVAGYATGNGDLRDAIWGCGATTIANSVARNQVIYRLVGRTRPDSSKDAPVAPPARHGDQYDLKPFPKQWGSRSLPGGHVANIAACASFLAERFHLGAGEPALYALVGAVGLGRIADRAHWTSDQVLGVALGYAIGREVALRQNRRREAARASGRDVGVAAGAPRPAGEGLFIGPALSGGMHVGWQKVF